MSATDMPEASLGELFGELGADLSRLLRKEVELAKIETREEAQRLTKAAVAGIVAALAALLALFVLSMALAWWIDEALNTAVAFAIVGVVWVVIAAVAAMTARSALERIRPLPETTDAVKAAVTGERAVDTASAAHDRSVLSPTHQISETRHDKETAS